ncbi:MAG: sigma-70 family RNA polymerase sigma factor [Actinophytocola sp.]|uniref:RNA polymerase sigma factor n=1 Tax=Actinophytocola sp. TaxID=1872138 RepID=UPI00132B9026|nr:RNA polymerase sigma factor [Actinophytocola sp.]MPZ80902.1 sigma-70 family RNA polymerase sigma factor [Actinophytocola sp.]
MTPGHTASADLSAAVRAARDGNQEAFRVLYREVQPGLLRYLRGMVGDDAEDLASEAWLQIARDIRSFRDEGAGFRGWAVGIARHRALDHVRRNQRRPVGGLSADVLADMPNGHDTAEQAIRIASTNATVALIATLPRDQAEAVLLRVVVGLDTHAAARVMGKRPGAVRTAAWRGLRRLAAQLDQRAQPAAAPADPDVTRTEHVTPKEAR